MTENNTENNAENNKIVEKRKINWGFTLFACVATGIIVFLSTNLGEKASKIIEPNTGSSQTSSITSNETSNIDSNANTLSNEEALNIGNNLYANAKNYYSHMLNQTDGCGNETVNAANENIVDCTTLYNTLSNYFATDNQVSRGSGEKTNIFSNFTNTNGKYYLTSSGSGFNGEATTTLAISKIEENKITYVATSVISTYNVQGKLEVSSTETDNFIIVKENNTWKVSYFVTRGI